jgi:lipopolysaccharide transport system permease protein
MSDSAGPAPPPLASIGGGVVASVSDLARSVWTHRQLTVELAKRQISDRYLGQVFGLFWAIGHPLILIATYVFVFAYVFRIRIGGTDHLPLDYTAYLLSGLIPWLSFQESMSNASVVVTNNAALVKQLVFPVEVLPAKAVVASLISQSILIGLLILYVVVTQQSLTWMLLLVPVVLLLQSAAMGGVAYGLAAIGVYFRDAKDFVQVLTVIGMYLMPIFYLPEAVPSVVRPLLYLNPVSYMVWVYQDVLYYGQFEHWWAWPVLAGLSVVSVAVGCHLFERLKTMFGNVL